ncbi:hypothetical protein V5O48_009806 [Marasmius crinis-equi]|uniref:BZIP domain-containing protein n=1 Tax=Marasmius crinis-equi TaxID=585013 RepID=A0ABR3FA66_9AGAR
MPSQLQGLNIIHPAQPEVDSHDLLAGAPFPDITAQLALWNSLPFESEEGGLSSQIDLYDKVPPTGHDLGKKRGQPIPPAAYDSHLNDNVIGPTEQPVPQFSLAHQPQPFDLNSIITSFQQQQDPLQTPLLAQIQALYSLSQPPPDFSASTDSNSTQESNNSNGASVSLPPAKRPRSRKTSVSTEADSPAQSPLEGAVATLVAAEDKRRRNTAASARFRQKKKERESALETKAKELEARVNELERECEALRRENGWLKGLVVGVTGAAQQQAPQSSPVVEGNKGP